MLVQFVMMETGSELLAVPSSLFGRVVFPSVLCQSGGGIDSTDRRWI